MNKEDIYKRINEYLNDFNKLITVDDLKIEKNLKISSNLELKKYYQTKLKEFLNDIINKSNLFNNYEFINSKPYELIAKNKISTISNYFNKLSYNNNILLRFGIEDNNFFSVLEKFINNLDKKYKNNLIKVLSKNLNLSESDIKLLLEKNDNSFIKEDIRENFFNEKFYQELANQLYLLFELSIILIIPSNNNIEDKKSIFIYTNQPLPKKVYFINIIIDLNANTQIYYEPVLVLNLLSKNLNLSITDNEFIKKINENLEDKFLEVDKERIYQPLFLEESEINEIKFDPYDKNEDLPIIEIEIEGEGEKRTFLLGKTNNLYEDDNHLNNLVGKLKFIDDTYTEAKIYWCKDYIE